MLRKETIIRIRVAKRNIQGDDMRKNLKEMRIKKGYTQHELAKKIGIERSFYTNIELGTKNPSLRVAMRIKQVLEYFNDDIFFNL